MVVDARQPEPNDQPQDDLTITIHMLRPRPAIPAGSISMNVEKVGGAGVNEDQITTGHHDDYTIKRVLQDLFDYYRLGRRSWASRIDRNGHNDRQR